MKIILTILIACSFLVAQDEDIFNTCSNEGCHGIDIGGKSIVHSAIEDGCDTCHELNSENEHPAAEGNEFSLSTDEEELCLDCHDSEEQTNYIHEPVDSGECIACHDPHSSDNNSLLKSDVDFKLCETCHELDFWQNKRSHGPVASGNCFNCHEPHSSKHKKLLIKNTQNLCFMCHENIKESNSMLHLHSPFKLNCLSCHDSHGGLKENILINTIPELCYTCHENTKLHIEKTQIKHGAILETKKCMNCHSPHASNEPSLLLEKENDTCLECHNKEIETENRTIKNIKAILSKGKFTHSPLQDGCITCHDPHAADNSFLLDLNYSSDIYNSDAVSAFSLCFDCHDENMLKSEFTSNDTDFRNGNRNLHFLHSNNDKSRNCSVCHNVHAAENEKLISSHLTFGKWKMPLNFKITENGGSCLPGCHQQYPYSRIEN